MRLRAFLLLAAAAVPSACGSSRPVTDPLSPTPDAVPRTKDMNDAADAAGRQDPGIDARSQSRVLAYVNGEVVSYRDLLLQAPPQLETLDNPAERAEIERRTLFEILQERILQRAAIDAGIVVSRDDLDKERAKKVRELEKNQGTLDAYLRSRGESRREFDEEIRREVRITRYIRAAVGVSNDPSVRVRAITDTFVSPRDMRAYYERNLDKFREPGTGRVRVLEIKVDRSLDDRDAAVAAARARAESARARLAAGEDWVPVYRDVNRGAAEPDPDDGLVEITDKGRGSKWAGWIEDFAFDQPRGTLSDVRAVGSSLFYVLRAEGYTPPRLKPYDEVQPNIQNGLSRMRYLVATYEVALSLLEESAITPRARYDELRDYLTATRRALISDAGL